MTCGFIAVLFAVLLGLPATSGETELDAEAAELDVAGGSEFRLAPLERETAFELGPFPWEEDVDVAVVGDGFQLAPLG